MQGDADETREDVLNQVDRRSDVETVEDPPTVVQGESSAGVTEPAPEEPTPAEVTGEAAPSEPVPSEAAVEAPPAEPPPPAVSVAPPVPVTPVTPPLVAPELPVQPVAEAPVESEAAETVSAEPYVEAAEATAPAVEPPPLQVPPPVPPQSAPDVGGMPGAPMPGLPDASAEADDEADDESIGFEELTENYSPEIPEIRPGTRREGRIVSIEPNGILVAFGAKTEGLLSLDHFRDAEGNITAQPDQEIQVIFERFGDPGEFAVLSYHDAAEDEAWRKIEAAYEAKTPLEAKIEERVKGGLRVDIGVSAFLPGSQVDVRPIHDLESLIGRTIEVLLVKVNRRRANVVVSRRELLEAEVQALKKETIGRLKEGEPVRGRVKNITSYGVFVDLGGLDGLIHLTDISYGRVKDPAEILKPGTEVTALVLRFDAEKERVSLSTKHLEPDPWEGIEQRYTTGDKVKGKVASITDYGAFVELESGVEGLIHITEMTWSRRLRHPSKVVKVDEGVESVVLKVSPEDRRISLSLKQLNADPWRALGDEFQVGKIVEGRVRNVTTYGAFVEIREGIDGLVHVSDLTWDSRVKNPKEVVRKGQELKTVILHVDQKNRRLSLGVKQLEPDAWDAFLSEHASGDFLPGLVTRMAKFGAFVEVAPGVEGLCHNSQIPRKGRKGGPALQVGKRYQFEILRVNEIDRKIGLRCESSEPIVEAAVVEAVTSEQPLPLPREKPAEQQASEESSAPPVETSVEAPAETPVSETPVAETVEVEAEPAPAQPGEQAEEKAEEEAEEEALPVATEGPAAQAESAQVGTAQAEPAAAPKEDAATPDIAGEEQAESSEPAAETETPTETQTPKEDSDSAG